MIAFLVSRWAHRRFGLFEFDGVTDGIVYGAAVGIGFAFTEDLYYFFREARAVRRRRRARRVHRPPRLPRPGDAPPRDLDRDLRRRARAATRARSWRGKVGWPLLGLFAAMLMHAVNNGLMPILLSIKYGFETTYDYFAVGVPVELADRMDASAESIVDTLELDLAGLRRRRSSP